QRGYTYYTMGKPTEAVADFTSAINLQPDLAAAYYCRGLANSQLAKKDAAIKDLAQAKSLGYEGDFSLLDQLLSQ
ncbi:MAG: tetratricopeptide repeat protein, partial [Chitinophagales bacterium]